MSLALLDGAEHRISPRPPFFDNTSAEALYASPGRYSAGSYFYDTVSGTTTRWKIPTASLSPEVWIGLAFKEAGLVFSDLSQPIIACFGDGTATQHVSAYLNADGSIALWRGTTTGTLLGTTATGLIVGTIWNYLELRALINDSTGAYELRINGVNVLSASGVDTRNGGTSPNVTVFGGGRSGGNGRQYDDLYCTTGDGVGTSGFQNEISIERVSPSGNGNYSQLVGQDGNSVDNYLNVDELPFSATDYNGSATVGQKDTYAMSNLIAVSGSILGTVLHMGVMKNNAGFIRGRRVIRIAATDYNGADLPSLSASMVPYSELIEKSPATAVSWTISEVNGMEAGFEVRT